MSRSSKHISAKTGASSSPRFSDPTSAKRPSPDLAAPTGFERKATAALENIVRAVPALGPESPVVVGVSGGRDSVALLHFLISRGWENLVVAHFNHGLRGAESGQDAAFVRRLAKKHGLTFEVERKDVACFAQKTGYSLETAARQERERFFGEVCLAHRTSAVFLAHHLEDNAETILGNLFRGSGNTGISGMKFTTVMDSGLVKLRPLLNVRRGEIDDYLAVNQLNFREDSSNRSHEYRRNRLRHEVMPLLDSVFQRDTASTTVRFGALAGRDDDCLNELALAFMDDHSLVTEDASFKIATAIRSLHPALLSRILRYWLIGTLGLRGLGNREIEAALAMLSPSGPSKINLPHDRHLRRKAKRLFVE